MKALVQTDDGWTGVILRLTLGLVMLPHGAQKLLGWFGGFGLDGTRAISPRRWECLGLLPFS
jgi:putative oxidoreductase